MKPWLMGLAILAFAEPVHAADPPASISGVFEIGG